MVAYSDYLRPMSTLPDQDGDTSWWLVKKQLWPMTEFLLGRDTIETSALQDVPAFMEVMTAADTEKFTTHKTHSYLDASLKEIKASLRSFGGRARSP